MIREPGNRCFGAAFVSAIEDRDSGRATVTAEEVGSSQLVIEALITGTRLGKSSTELG